MGDIVHITKVARFKSTQRECYPALILKVGDPGPLYISVHAYGEQHTYKTIAKHGLGVAHWHTREECVDVERR